MNNHSIANDRKNFFKRHHIYIKSDFTKFAIYTFFTPMEPFHFLFILYAKELLGSYTIAGMLMSLKVATNLILQILFSGIKDRKELKYILGISEFFSGLAYVFFILAPMFSEYMLALICIGIFSFSLGGALWRGTYNSFIYEDFEKEHPEVGSKPYSQLQVFLSVGTSVGVILAATLAGIFSYATAMYVGVISNFISVALAFSLKGPKKCKNEESCYVKPEISIVHFGKTVAKMFKNEKLRYISTAEIIRTASINSFNSFSVPFYRTFMPISTLGYVQTVKEMAVAVSFGFSDLVIKKMKFYKAIKMFYIIRWVLMGAAVIVNGLLSPVLLICRSLFFGPMVTSTEYMMQKHYSTAERVTMSSSLSILSGVLTTIFTIILGYIAEQYSVQYALGVIVPLYVIPYILYKKQFKILGKE